MNYQKSIEAFDLIADKKSKSQMINNLGLVFKNQSKLSKAESCFLEAYKISKDIKYMTFQAYVEEELADNYRLGKNYPESKKYFDLAMAHEKEANYVVLTQNILNGIHNYYKEIGDYTKALNYFEKYASLTDSLNLINQNQRILEVETRMRTNEKQKEITHLNKEKDLQEEEIKRGKVIMWLAGAVIVVVLVFFGYMWRSRQKQKEANRLLAQKNREIEAQKKLVEEHQKEILDSIHYASRIQRALITSERYIEKSLKKLIKG